jgi:hypothetical protein
MMAGRPQTLYGLADSPVALAAWMTDDDVASYGHIAKLFVDGSPYGALSRLGSMSSTRAASSTTTTSPFRLP